MEGERHGPEHDITYAFTLEGREHLLDHVHVHA
jgi:hypothetical protein